MPWCWFEDLVHQSVHAVDLLHEALILIGAVINSLPLPCDLGVKMHPGCQRHSGINSKIDPLTVSLVAGVRGTADRLQPRNGALVSARFSDLPVLAGRPCLTGSRSRPQEGQHREYGKCLSPHSHLLVTLSPAAPPRSGSARNTRTLSHGFHLLASACSANNAAFSPCRARRMEHREMEATLTPRRIGR